MTTPFLADIAASPEAIHDALAWYAGPGQTALTAWRDGLAGVRRVIVVGMGTSLFAPQTMRQGLAAAGVRLTAAEAGEWLHGGESPAAGERLVLCSQSGRSAELVRIVAAGVPPGTVAITNEPDSPLALGGGLVLPLRAGTESNISSKTYVNTLAVGHLMGAAAAGDATWHPRLAEVAESLRQADEAAIERAADALAGVHALAVLGRGGAVPAVNQLALIMGEGARLMAVPFTGGGFRHGPIEACAPTLGMVALAGTDRQGELTLGACADAAANGCPVVVLTDRAEVPAGCLRVPLPPGRDATDLSLRASRAQALLIHHLAARRGFVAGRNRINAKVTDRE